jgi:hypothetical protein
LVSPVVAVTAVPKGPLDGTARPKGKVFLSRSRHEFSRSGAPLRLQRYVIIAKFGDI